VAGFLRRIFWRYFVHDFSALSVFVLLGVPLLMFGLAFGVWEYLTLLPTNSNASPGVVMLAAMPIILGVQMLLQAVVLDVGNIPRQPLSSPLRPTGIAAGLR